MTTDQLLQQIKREPDVDVVARYRELVSRRRGGELTADETRELLHLSDTFEVLHALRMQAVSELAQRWDQSLAQTMEQLGIKHLLNDE